LRADEPDPAPERTSTQCRPADHRPTDRAAEPHTDPYADAAPDAAADPHTVQFGQPDADGHADPDALLCAAGRELRLLASQREEEGDDLPVQRLVDDRPGLHDHLVLELRRRRGVFV